MENSTGFSTAFRGYDSREVDEYIETAKQREAELRAGCETLQKKYDGVCEQLTKLTQERDHAVADCTALASALQQLRQNAPDEENEDYKAKYEAAAKELEELKAEKKDGKAAEAAGDSVQVASDMVSEVAQAVQKVEAEARRKAEALTTVAKLEKAQADLILNRMLAEVRSLMEMLNGFLEQAPKNTEEEEQP